MVPPPARMIGVPAAREASPVGAPLLDIFLGYVSSFFHEPARHAARSILTQARRGGSTQIKRLVPRSQGLRQPLVCSPIHPQLSARRHFHSYFVTHLPSSSLHPDSRSSSGPGHKLPRAASTPHKPQPGSSPAASPTPNMPTRDLTVVRIPLRSAKHHFGAHVSRGQRPYNEDTNQAGTIDIPAFARRAPISLVRSARLSTRESGEGTSADGALGDPQIFYFAVFDGHGGSECSEFLRDELHRYIEEAAGAFELPSSLRPRTGMPRDRGPSTAEARALEELGQDPETKRQMLDRIGTKSGMKSKEVRAEMKAPEHSEKGVAEEPTRGDKTGRAAAAAAAPVPARGSVSKAVELQRELVDEYKYTVGGYFRRFQPPCFDLSSTSSGQENGSEEEEEGGTGDGQPGPISAESALTYAFLRADLDFVTAQAHKPDPDDPHTGDDPLNDDEILGAPQPGHKIGGPARFKGGSTASVALISTPTPAPFWHPAAHSTLLVAHVGDTRILLCETATGLAQTADLGPPPQLADRGAPPAPLSPRSLVTDSLRRGAHRRPGQQPRLRRHGQQARRRLGRARDQPRVELGPAEYAFLVLVSDGVSGTLSDQEIVDVVKEAKTPEQGARDVVEFATEVSRDGDNATCLVVRLGGWERRSEGGLGSMGTKEIRDIRRAEAQDPRRGRR